MKTIKGFENVKHGVFCREHLLNHEIKQQAMYCAKHLGFDDALIMHQVHGDVVQHVTETWEYETRFDCPEADAMVTKQKNILLIVQTADCAPVIFLDEQAGIVAAAHAGWRGAVAGILENTIDKMISLGASLDRIKAGYGPMIHQNSYEVGKELYDQFTQKDASADRFFKEGKDAEHFFFNLPGFVRDRLEAAGIQHITGIDEDTYTHPETYASYRRATHTGDPNINERIMTVIGL